MNLHIFLDPVTELKKKMPQGWGANWFCIFLGVIPCNNYDTTHTAAVVVAEILLYRFGIYTLIAAVRLMY